MLKLPFLIESSLKSCHLEVTKAGNVS